MLDDACHFAKRRCCLDQRPDRLSRGDIDGCSADDEPGLVKDFGGGGRVFKAKIGEQNVLACADPTRDRLADGAG